MLYVLLYFILPITAGLIAGYYSSFLWLFHLALVLYHIPQRILNYYDKFFELSENNYTYEMLGRERFKNNLDFLAYCEKLRPTVKQRFKDIWNYYALLSLKKYGIVLLISVFIFWYSYWAFIIPYILVLIYMFFYDNRLKLRDHDIMLTLMLEAVLFGKIGTIIVPVINDEDEI